MKPTFREWQRTTGRRAARIAALAVLLMGLASAPGDTLFLRGGEKLIGKVVADEKEQVVIESQTLGRLKIPREKIERVELEPASPASPANSTNRQGFVPPPPGVQPSLSATNAALLAAGSTNAPPKRPWWQLGKPADDKGTDWIQLKSGEWLRGKLYGMQNRSLEFESDELDDLKFDWKDVHQVVVPKALVSYGDRETAWGEVHADREKVKVSGLHEVEFPRYDLLGIAPGSPREIDYWSGKFDVGLNLRTGNTEQTDFVTKLKLERRTANTYLKLEYAGNFSETEDTETVNNQRVTEFFDLFLTRRLFVRVPQAEYYHDPFQNIAQRFTVGGGMGYYLIDQPKLEWEIAGGPAYQFIHFDNVEAEADLEQTTPAIVFQSNFDITLTKRVDFELNYSLIAANENSGGLAHHATATLEIELTRRLDLDVTFTWDRISNPQADASGAIPKNDDFRLDLSLGIKF
jgi:putative salt-induced outer membrane protein YdiY